MVQPRKSGTVFPIRRFSDKNSSFGVKSCSRVLHPRWLQDANSPALSGKVGVKRAGSVGGQQFAKVSPFLPQVKSLHNTDIFRWPRQECEVILAWRALGKLLSWFSNENSEKIIILAQPQKRKSLVFYLYHQQACSQF